MSFDPEEFYFSYGLYQKLPFTEDNFESLFRLIFPTRRLDLYCPYCQKETTFEPMPRREKKNSTSTSSAGDIYAFDDFKANYDFKYFHKGRKFEISYKCTREPYTIHSIYFQMIVDDEALMKIGQYPSIADLSNHSIKHYEGVLPKEYYKELNRAVGLFSHGIGIGSFVYMRRIFERLIFDVYNDHKDEIDVDYDSFKNKRMNEKIEVLSSFLPKTLVEKRALYGVLSKGIHSLDESACKESFPIVRAGIEFILDERIYQIAQKSKSDKFNKDFDEMVKKVK